MPQVISLAKFQNIEKYFGGKKLEFLNASIKKISQEKNPDNPGKKKKKNSSAMLVFFFPNNFVFFGQKYVE
jgi:hypothetical protein